MATTNPADIRVGTSLARSSVPSAFEWIALILLIVGGLNWATVGLFNLDLVAALFGPMSMLTRAVYVVVGLAAICVLAFAVRRGSDQPRLDR